MDLKKNKSGFTLVEMIVALSIFMIFIGVAFSSYLHITRVQRDLNEIRKMYSEVRNLVSMVAGEAREMTIDYDCYFSQEGVCFDVSFAQTTNRSDSLALLSKDGLKRTIFRYVKEPQEQGEEESGKVQLIKQDRRNIEELFQTVGRFQGEFADITFEGVNINDLAFVITPRRNPFSYETYLLNQYQFQPQTALFLEVGKKFQTQPDFSLNIQTALSSRVYGEVKSEPELF